MKLKICGITNKSDLLSCLPYVDAVGFIIGFPQSKRNISIKKAKELIHLTPPLVTTVLVIPDVKNIMKIYNEIHPDVIQLHGNETVEEVKQIRNKISCKLIKACGINNALDFSPYVDALLIDDKYGSYNFHEVNNLVSHSDVPIILAGHITPNNILTIIHQISPYAIDIASGVEEKPGKKDIKKIIQIKNILSLGPVVGSIIYKKKLNPSFQLYNAISSSDSISIISEIKPSSPSQGMLIDDEKSIDGLLSTMVNEGVHAISILVEEEYFQGSIELLKKIRKKTSLPLIAKGFFYTKEQIYELAKAGANAFLLMTRVVNAEGENLQELIACGINHKMDAMVEVSTLKEMNQAIEAGANIIEINNRNIYGDFSINFAHISIAKTLPKHVLLISASGIQKPNDIEQILKHASSKINAVLIGTSIMKSINSSKLISDLIKKGKEVYQ